MLKKMNAFNQTERHALQSMHSILTENREMSG